jgi:hypothetical protein
MTDGYDDDNNFFNGGGFSECVCLHRDRKHFLMEGMARRDEQDSFFLFDIFISPFFAALFNFVVNYF